MDTCIRRRLLFAAEATYTLSGSTPINPANFVAGNSPIGDRIHQIGLMGPISVVARDIDLAFVGRIKAEGHDGHADIDGILVAFRGTQPPVLVNNPTIVAVTLDWLNDAYVLPHSLGGEKWVHAGFWGSVDHLWNDDAGRPGIATLVQRLLDGGAPRKLYITGHSKGGPMANLAAWRFATSAGWLGEDIRVVTFAPARPGNEAFADAFRATGIVSTGYEVSADEVPRLPPGEENNRYALWLSRQFPRISRITGNLGYCHVGEPVHDRVALKDVIEEQWGRWQQALHTRELPLPLLAAAHSIGPGSDYDRLVCDNQDPRCGHT